MLASTGRMYSCNPILFTSLRRGLGNQGRPWIAPPVNFHPFPGKGGVIEEVAITERGRLDNGNGIIKFDKMRKINDKILTFLDPETIEPQAKVQLHNLAEMPFI